RREGHRLRRRPGFPGAGGDLRRRAPHRRGQGAGPADGSRLPGPGCAPRSAGGPDVFPPRRRCGEGDRRTVPPADRVPPPGAPRPAAPLRGPPLTPSAPPAATSVGVDRAAVAQRRGGGGTWLAAAAVGIDRAAVVLVHVG